PWAAAVPSGLVMVTHQRVRGWRLAAPTRARGSSGSSRPQWPAWAGGVAQPRGGAAGAPGVVRGGSGAGGGGRAPAAARGGGRAGGGGGGGGGVGGGGGGGGGGAGGGGGGFDPVEGVAALGEVRQGQGAQAVEGAVDEA